MQKGQTLGTAPKEIYTSFAGANAYVSVSQQTQQFQLNGLKGN